MDKKKNKITQHFIQHQPKCIHIYISNRAYSNRDRLNQVKRSVTKSSPRLRAMPHTSRNKRSTIPAQKRLQVTADDGWTHVTSGSNVRRLLRTTRVRNSDSITVNRYESEALESASSIPATTSGKTVNDESMLSPAEAPSRLTLPELQAQFRAYRERWRASETWAALAGCLDEWMRAQRGTAVQDSPVGVVDAIVCIGLGSPSGFLRDGWVDRRAVSMYQLAALESIKERLSGGEC